MFKPEYILEDVASFGYFETIQIIAAKFRRMGKGKQIAYQMAHRLVESTVWCPL